MIKNLPMGPRSGKKEIRGREKIMKSEKKKWLGENIIADLRIECNYSGLSHHFVGKPSLSKNARFLSLAALTSLSNDITSI